MCIRDSLYTGTYSSYQWYKNGATIVGATSSILASPSAGVYRVVVSDANGCFTSSGDYTINGGGGGGGTGVSNTAEATSVRVFPNPATSALNIEAPVTVNVSIVSPDGKVVLEQKQATTIDVSQLADGMYIIMVYDENNSLLKTDKFVKMKQ